MFIAKSQFVNWREAYERNNYVDSGPIAKSGEVIGEIAPLALPRSRHVPNGSHSRNTSVTGGVGGAFAEAPTFPADALFPSQEAGVSPGHAVPPDSAMLFGSEFPAAEARSSPTLAPHVAGALTPAMHGFEFPSSSSNIAAEIPPMDCGDCAAFPNADIYQRELSVGGSTSGGAPLAGPLSETNAFLPAPASGSIDLFPSSVAIAPAAAVSGGASGTFAATTGAAATNTTAAVAMPMLPRPREVFLRLSDTIAIIGVRGDDYLTAYNNTIECEHRLTDERLAGKRICAVSEIFRFPTAAPGAMGGGSASGSAAAAMSASAVGGVTKKGHKAKAGKALSVEAANANRYLVAVMCEDSPTQFVFAVWYEQQEGSGVVSLRAEAISRLELHLDGPVRASHPAIFPAFVEQSRLAAGQDRFEHLYLFFIVSPMEQAPNGSAGELVPSTTKPPSLFRVDLIQQGGRLGGAILNEIHVFNAPEVTLDLPSAHPLDPHTFSLAALPPLVAFAKSPCDVVTSSAEGTASTPRWSPCDEEPVISACWVHGRSNDDVWCATAHVEEVHEAAEYGERQGHFFIAASSSLIVVSNVRLGEDPQKVHRIEALPAPLRAAPALGDGAARIVFRYLQSTDRGRVCLRYTYSTAWAVSEECVFLRFGEGSSNMLQLISRPHLLAFTEYNPEGYAPEHVIEDFRSRDFFDADMGEWLGVTQVIGVAHPTPACAIGASPPLPSLLVTSVFSDGDQNWGTLAARVEVPGYLRIRKAAAPAPVAATITTTTDTVIATTVTVTPAPASATPVPAASAAGSAQGPLVAPSPAVATTTVTSTTTHTTTTLTPAPFSGTTMHSLPPAFASTPAIDEIGTATRPLIAGGPPPAGAPVAFASSPPATPVVVEPDTPPPLPSTTVTAQPSPAKPVSPAAPADATQEIESTADEICRLLNLSTTAASDDLKAAVLAKLTGLVGSLGKPTRA